MTQGQAEDYNLSDFVREMTAVVERIKNDAERVAEAERLIGKLIRTISWLPSEKRKPDVQAYARHSIYHDPKDRFEVIALVWQPGQCTPLHDHDGTWGAEGVVAGRIKVTNYQQVGVLADDVVSLQQTGTVIVNEQDTGRLLPPADCHILETEDGQTAITVHVYGKQLRKFRVFEPLGEDGTYKTHEHYVDYNSL